MDSWQLRDKVSEALARGRFGKAAELLEDYCALEPLDHQSRLRLGDAWVKAGDTARAVRAYQAAAEGFARGGFLPRAIATSKRILELEPSHQGIQHTLASLYARQSETGFSRPAHTPAPLPPAATEPRAALLIELPPEIDEALEVALPEAPGRALAPAPEPTPEPAPEIEVELDLESPAEPSPVVAAPPGLRRRSTELPAVSPASASGSFRALALEADSLLHAVELAAANASAPEPAEEPVSAPPGAEERGLPEIPLFSDLPREAFIALFERCALRPFAEGERIIAQDSRGNAFYVICAGRVRIVREAGGRERELAVLGEGAFFGEMALLSGAPRSASVVALEETQVLEISAPVLGELARRHPQVARALRRFCRQRMLSEVVNTSALFQPFGRKDRRELVERFRAREVRRGEVLIHEGQLVDGLYVVLSGEVSVSKEDQPLAHLREGELFGEMSLLHKTPATATVTAVRNTSLLRLPREDFDTLILTHPQVLVLVSELTDARQRSNDALFGGGAPASERASAPSGPLEELILV